MCLCLWWMRICLYASRHVVHVERANRMLRYWPLFGVEYEKCILIYLPTLFCPESRCLRKIGFMNLTSTTFKKYLKISLRVHSNLSHYRYSLHLNTTRMQSNKIFFLLLLVWANMRMSKKCESYTGRYWSMHQIFCCLIWNDERDSWFSIHINISIVLPSDHW